MSFCLLMLCEVPPDTCIRTWVVTQRREARSRSGTAVDHPARVMSSGSSDGTWWDTTIRRLSIRHVHVASCVWVLISTSPTTLGNWSDQLNVIHVSAVYWLYSVWSKRFQSVINNNLSLMSYVRVSTSTGHHGIYRINTEYSKFCQICACNVKYIIVNENCPPPPPPP